LASALADRLGKADGCPQQPHWELRPGDDGNSKAKEAGAQALICASTGNTSAAAAAYAKRGGMRVFVL